MPRDTRHSERLAAKKVASSPYSLRSNTGLPQGRSRPPMPRQLWNGERPSFDSTTVANMKRDAKSGNGYSCAICGKVIEEKEVQLDHKKDWRTYIYSKCSFSEHTINGHKWRGYLQREVKDAYNDERNLQVTCPSCNSSKSGPKSYDKEKPEYIGPV